MVNIHDNKVDSIPGAAAALGKKHPPQAFFAATRSGESCTGGARGGTEAVRTGWDNASFGSGSLGPPGGHRVIRWRHPMWTKARRK